MMGSTHLQQQKITDYGYNTADASETAPVTGVGRAMRRLAGWFSRGHDRMTRMTVWVRRRTLWSKGAEKRGQKAVAILERQDQIRYVHPGLYSVQSQSQPGLFYFVKLTPTGRWVCDCPDHQHRKAQCKHILAVSALVSDKEALAVLNAPGDDACESRVKCGLDEGPQKSIDDVAYRDSCKGAQKHPKKPAKAKQDVLEKPDAEESKASKARKKMAHQKRKRPQRNDKERKHRPQSHHQSHLHPYRM